jgi:hypothetical protein
MNVHDVESVIRKHEVMNVSLLESRIFYIALLRKLSCLIQHLTRRLNAYDDALWYVICQINRDCSWSAANIKDVHVGLEVWEEVGRAIGCCSPFVRAEDRRVVAGGVIGGGFLLLRLNSRSDRVPNRSGRGP